MKKSRKEYKKAWRRANPDKARAHDARWYWKNHQKKLRAVAEWRKKNPKRVTEQNDRRKKLGKSAAAMRKYQAKKNGWVECTEYPPLPADGRCESSERRNKPWQPIR